MSDRCARCRHDFADHMDSPDEECAAPGCWCRGFQEDDERPPATPAEKREALLQDSMARMGKSREQVEAVMDILGSAFRRRGWVEGEPLSQDEIAERIDTMTGRAGTEETP